MTFRTMLVVTFVAMNMINKTYAGDPAIPPTLESFGVSTNESRFAEIPGTMIDVKNFRSKNLDNLHNISIYLPPQYDEDDTTSYPVLYTIGWDSLFITGSADPLPEGHVIHPENDSIPSLLKKEAIKPFIMVCVSPDLDRNVSLMDECAPTRVERLRERDGVVKKSVAGGKVDLFAKFMIEEVKPWIDERYRTTKNPAEIGITGISKWGMGTMYIAVNNPDEFGMWGGMSPALSWDKMEMAHVVDRADENLAVRVWMGSGEFEGHYLDDMSLFKRLFISKGIASNDVEVLIVKDGNHSGLTWGPSVGPMLKFMFGVDDKGDGK